ncbi:unnamed protein product [Owenia fusiformis]|uniref:Uncharacterized protein n=1 Tax=Owenia fusiformis TaxID=6347 RepID=A0A8J1XG38_OWEFU|nr:unnamed protein product [Owenia fusiformis]
MDSLTVLFLLSLNLHFCVAELTFQICYGKDNPGALWNVTHEKEMWKNVTLYKSLNGTNCGIVDLPRLFTREDLSCMNHSFVIEKVELSFNLISSIENQTFNCLKELKYLDLSHNMISELKGGIFDGLVNLEVVKLNDNRIHSMEDGVLTDKHKHISFLDLSCNMLTVFGGNIDFFKRYSANSCITVNVTHNAVSKLQLDLNSYHKVRDSDFICYYVFLQFNNITDLNLGSFGIFVDALSKNVAKSYEHEEIDLRDNPFICDCNVRLFHKLMQSFKTIFKQRFEWLELEKLKCASPEKLEGSSIAELPSEELFCRVYKHCPFSCQCIFKEDFDEPSINYLLPENTGYLRVLCAGQNLTALPTLIPYRYKDKLPTQLLLNLSQNSIEHLVPLDYIELVTHLDLSHNRIKDLSLSMMKIFSNLSVLYLNGNHLQYMPEDMRTIQFRNMKKMHLNDNKFICDCSSIWMENYFAAIRNKLSVMPKCYNKDALINDMKINQTFCWLNMTALLSCTITLGIVLLIGALIAYYLYPLVKILYCNRINDTAAENMDDVKYDAYVIYHPDDTEWVIEHIIGLLEPQYKLCIPQRDFRPENDELLVDIIMRSLEESRRSIVVLTQTFIRDNECKAVFAQAHGYFMRNPSQKMMLVVQDEAILKDNCLDDGINLYIKTCTYLAFRKRFFKKRILNEMPIKSIQDFNHA